MPERSTHLRLRAPQSFPPNQSRTSSSSFSPPLPSPYHWYQLWRRKDQVAHRDCHVTDNIVDKLFSQKLNCSECKSNCLSYTIQNHIQEKISNISRSKTQVHVCIQHIFICTKLNLVFCLHQCCMSVFLIYFVSAAALIYIYIYIYTHILNKTKQTVNVEHCSQCYIYMPFNYDIHMIYFFNIPQAACQPPTTCVE